ncbi:unnamed protein product [Prorocentrum cordatum]|uniref:Uncharacterized protein n=1 Tax=Prorocentrum cordatum TaxID=2364126 RepID=A0ABN9RAX1_9DINO|nr:unnamed protein product [Polarella glacialis]|mmetsp:Transcript_124422/g.337925  ORF Transcript_124422/g.337925 Transcript_124422/m.337925 type:complete len:408 (-) Transcript_124422:269-1492(-)
MSHRSARCAPDRPPSAHDRWLLDDAVRSIKTSFRNLDRSKAKLDVSMARARTHLATHLIKASAKGQPPASGARPHAGDAIARAALLCGRAGHTRGVEDHGLHARVQRCGGPDGTAGWGRRVGLASPVAAGPDGGRDQSDGTESCCSSSSSCSGGSSEDAAAILAALHAAAEAPAPAGPPHEQQPPRALKRGNTSGASTSRGLTAQGSDAGTAGVARSGSQTAWRPSFQPVVPRLSVAEAVGGAQRPTTPTPRFEVCQRPNRPFSAARVRAFQEAGGGHTGPAAEGAKARPRSAMLARQWTRAVHGVVPETALPGTASHGVVPPPTAGVARGAGTSADVRPALAEADRPPRPRSAFAPIQRRQPQGAQRCRPPVAPCGEPQARWLSLEQPGAAAEGGPRTARRRSTGA